MNFYKKNTISKYLFLILTTLLIIMLGYFLINNDSNNETTFKNFMESYKSKNIIDANKYLLDNQLPNINNIFSINIENSNDNVQTEIIKLFENLFYSINYNIISKKTFLNKSTLNINFNYYDLSRYIINLFKDPKSHEINVADFINSIKTTKYNISKNLDVELVKKNKQWYIVLSENLINILTAGLYKNFVI